jgi:hypothetical protein
MKGRPWPFFIALLTLGVTVAFFAWHRAGVPGTPSPVGSENSFSYTPVQKPLPEEKTSISQLSRALADRWRFRAVVDPKLQGKEILLPASSTQRHKALEALGQELGLPAALSADDQDAAADVYIGVGGIIWGEKNDDLNNAMEGLATDLPENRADHVHNLASLNDNRVESVLLWALTNSKEAAVRGAAAFELASATSPNVHRALVKSLSDEDDLVRDQARTAIEQIGGTTMEPLLRTAMQSPNDVVAMEAGDLLERAFGLDVPAEFWTRFNSN